MRSQTSFDCLLLSPSHILLLQFPCRSCFCCFDDFELFLVFLLTFLKCWWQSKAQCLLVFLVFCCFLLKCWWQSNAQCRRVFFGWICWVFDFFGWNFCWWESWWESWWGKRQMTRWEGWVDPKLLLWGTELLGGEACCLGDAGTKQSPENTVDPKILWKT